MGWFQNLNKKFTQSQEEARKKAEEAKLEAIKIKCPLCKGSIPANATRCSHCAGDLTGKEAKDSIKTQIEASKKQSKIAVGILIILLLVGFWYFYSWLLGDTPSSTQPTSIPQTRTQQAQFKLTAKQLMAEYEANEIAASAKYDDKIIEVSGKVGDIDTEITGKPFVTIEISEYSIFNVQCLFARNESNLLVNLTKGQPITLKGKVTGKLGNVIVDECVIIK